MEIVILDKATLGQDINLDVLNVRDDFIIKEYFSSDNEQVKERITNADIVIVNKVKLDKENLAYAKKLKLICIAATGFDNVDLNYCKNNNIAVTNVSGYSTDSVAQITVSMALYLLSHIKEYTRFVNDGSYTKSNTPTGMYPVYHEIAGKTWGIIGLGNIGKKVAKVASALGCNVIVAKKTPIEGYNIKDIDTLCRESDIISIHTPLNEETKGLLSSERIAIMKRDVIVINVARGGVVDEDALCEAVLNKKIAGVGIDVYTTEPFGENHPYNKIKGMDNVCLTPHMAWASYEARVRLVEEIAENIKAFLNSQKRNRLV